MTTSLTETTASATVAVAAPPAEVFAYLADPAHHADISGDRSVIGPVGEPGPLGPEQRFRMRMRRGPIRYRITSTVVEYDRDRVIAWAHLGGHRWRWELEPDGHGGTLLTETYDQSMAGAPWLLRLLGYPGKHVDNVARSVANVAARFAP